MLCPDSTAGLAVPALSSFPEHKIYQQLICRGKGTGWHPSSPALPSGIEGGYSSAALPGGAQKRPLLSDKVKGIREF
eukprot:scaffold226952_cov23-Tisochrysis_lutea.AAC.2